MKTIILACKTLSDELYHAMNILNCNFEICWIDSELHNFPEKLRVRMQKELDNLNDANRVLMAFGTCGNSVVGLKTGKFELILPRVDDCISLLIGSDEKRKNLTQDNATYFLTKGWLDGERNIWTEYQYTVEKYGEKKADSIMEMMFSNYKRLAVLDTKSYDIASIIPKTKNIACKLCLDHEVLPGSISYICDLLTGPWDTKRFMTVAMNTEIT